MEKTRIPLQESVLGYLYKDLEALFQKEWQALHHKTDCAEERDKIYGDARRAARSGFEALQPREDVVNNATVRAWLVRFVRHMPSDWEMLKTSALFFLFGGYPRFVFSVAGELICHLKAYSRGTPNPIVPGIYCHMKYKKNKDRVTDLLWRAAEDEEEEEVETEEDGGVTEVDPDEDVGPHNLDPEQPFYDSIEDTARVGQLEEMMFSSSLS